MLKWLHSPRLLFGALRIVAVAAIIAGVWLSLTCGVLQVFDRNAEDMGAGYVVTALMNCALWCIAWASFCSMCTRLMKGGTAFTVENSRALHTIGTSVSMISAIMCLRALPRLFAAPDVYLIIEAIILPGTFLTVGVLAFILSRLLKHAMALEEDQADVV